MKALESSEKSCEKARETFNKEIALLKKVRDLDRAIKEKSNVLSDSEKGAMKEQKQIDDCKKALRDLSRKGRILEKEEKDLEHWIEENSCDRGSGG